MTSNPSASTDEDLRWPGQLAAIDMGSNSFRLEIGQLLRPLPPHRLPEGDRAPRRRPRRRRLLRRRGRARPRVPGRFAQRLDGFAPSQVRAVATQTLREATQPRRLPGARPGDPRPPIEIISGREEARLIFAGVARLQPSTCRAS
jgi:exopolyphosphatase/guanosine-5'-triphosphate,3'-diphosphate pyrophosphatase